MYTIPKKTAAKLDERTIGTALGDWPEGDEHQRWLNTASAREIREWADDIHRDQDSEAALDKAEGR